MKIIFLLSRFEKSGVALHSLDLAHGLIEAGHNLTLICGGITDNENEYLRKLYTEYQNLGVDIRIVPLPKGSFIRKITFGLVGVSKILWILLKSEADIIHCQSPYLTLFPWFLRKKFVATVHNVQLTKRWNYKNPTALIAISEESKSFAISILGAHPDRVHVVWHGVSQRYAKLLPDTKKKSLRNEFGIGPDAIVIGYAGRITKEKGIDDLIKATEDFLAASSGSNIYLVLLGDYYTESDRYWLEGRIEQSPIRTRIRKIPFQDPLPIYNIFDIFVLPSLSEAFGLVCVEAMMCGCCTIRTNTNGATDQINHGEDGFIYEKGNPQALLGILQPLLNSPEQITYIGLKGREKALRLFTIEEMTRKTVEVYEKTI